MDLDDLQRLFTWGAIIAFLVAVLGVVGEVLGWWHAVGELMIGTATIVSILMGVVALLLNATKQQVVGVSSGVRANGDKLDVLHGDMGGLHTVVGGLREDVGGLRGDVGGLREDVGGLREDVGGLRLEIGGVRTEVGAVRDEVGGVRHAIGGLRGDVGGLRGDVAGLRSGQTEQTALLREIRDRL